MNSEDIKNSIQARYAGIAGKSGSCCSSDCCCGGGEPNELFSMVSGDYAGARGMKRKQTWDSAAECRPVMQI
ncbi:hypothetical protein [Marispirochaeta aestuarii]|uniref:hypothetical protein n=1 Tax=Marispirochaeta aestuarii TaxID=1963862 RepID=UPI0029C756B9|nr:hypothetical protein [Marispirochaeta aestuarii]